MALLLIDQGNSNTKIQVRSLSGEILQTTQSIVNFEQNQFLQSNKIPISHVALASVAKAETKRWLKESLTKQLGSEVLLVEAETETELSTPNTRILNSYRDPSQMGVDRWLAVVAGVTRYPNRGIVIVDSGSAVNIELVNSNAQHLGGYIIPGFTAMIQTLHNGTGQVKVDRQPDAYSVEPGDNTLDCVNNGIAGAIVGLITDSIARLTVQSLTDEIQVVMAGGDSAKLAPLISSPTEIVPDLVLDGLFQWFNVKCI